MRIAVKGIAIPQPTPALVEPGFLHTSPVHVPTFEALLAEVAPSARALSVVDEQLLADARQLGPAAVADRVATALRGLRDHGASIVCCTCSTIGEVAEQVDVGIPVFRVDRPMAVRAVQTGARVGVVAAVTSTIEPTSALLESAARQAGRAIDVRPVLVAGAWACFETGDLAGYLDLVAEEARALAPDVDVIVLAQASMAGAQATLDDLPIPVLSSPRAAVEHLAARLSPGSLPGTPLLDPVDGRPDAVLASHRCLDLLRSCQHPISLLDG